MIERREAPNSKKPTKLSAFQFSAFNKFSIIGKLFTMNFSLWENEKVIERGGGRRWRKTHSIIFQWSLFNSITLNSVNHLMTIAVREIRRRQVSWAEGNWNVGFPFVIDWLAYRRQMNCGRFLTISPKICDTQMKFHSFVCSIIVSYWEDGGAMGFGEHKNEHQFQENTKWFLESIWLVFTTNTRPALNTLHNNHWNDDWSSSKMKQYVWRHRLTICTHSRFSTLTFSQQQHVRSSAKVKNAYTESHTHERHKRFERVLPSEAQPGR